MLSIETAAVPVHVGSVLVLDGPAPEPEELASHLAQRLAHLPSVRRRLQPRMRGLRRPCWVDAPEEDVARHLRVARVAPPGDDRELRRTVTSVMTPRVDLAPPPWEAWLVTGLEDGRWALALKAHHVMADGSIGAALLRALLDGPPGPAPSPAPAVAAPSHGRLRLLRGGLRAVTHPDLPDCGLNATVGPRRDWGWVDLDAEHLVGAARSHGCRVNDVYLAVLAGGYRRLLMARGVDLDAVELRTLVPASLRARGLPARGTNMDAGFFVDLPVRLAEPSARLDDVARQSAEAVASHVPESTGALLRTFDAVPQPVLSAAGRGYARHGQRRVAAAATYVRGPQDVATLAGRPVHLMLPFAPVALDVVTSCALLTYAARAVVGITADADAVPDLDELLAGVAASAEELLGRRRT